MPTYVNFCNEYTTMRKTARRLIRRFALWIKYKTDPWVVSDKIWELIDSDQYDNASVLIEQARKEWPNDPELVFAAAIVDFMRE